MGDPPGPVALSAGDGSSWLRLRKLAAPSGRRTGAPPRPPIAGSLGGPLTAGEEVHACGAVGP